MPKRRRAESDENRSHRLEKNAQNRAEQASAEDKALDAAVIKSIKQYGA
jgi:hypothetical protein